MYLYSVLFTCVFIIYFISFFFYLFLFFPFNFLCLSLLQIGSDNCVNMVLSDTERTLALLQGLQACFMVQGLPVLPCEEECDKWLSLEIFSSGLEQESFSSSSTSLQPKLAPVEVGPVDPPLDVGPKSLQQRSSCSPCLFIHGLTSTDSQDEKVAMFLSLVQRYYRKKNLYLPHIEQFPDHPLVKFGHLFMACLLKMHDLTPIALSVVEQEGPPNNEHNSISVQLPPSLVEVCKLVYEAKISLVKAHQESLCSYEEVCREPIARCRFIVDCIRSPMLNVMNIFHKHQLQVHAHVQTHCTCGLLALIKITCGFSA